MWPWILGSAGIGSVLGGIQGYQRSGGDLGATLQGAAGGGLMGGITGGLGAGATRMAGTAMEAALAGSGPVARAASSVAPDVYKAGEAVKALRAGAGVRGAQQAAAQAGLAAPLAQQAGGLNILGKVLPPAAGLAAGLAVPALATPLISAGANLAGQAAGGALRAAPGLGGSPQGWGAPAQYGGDAIPPGMGQFGYVDAYGNPIDIASPAGVAAGRRLEYAKTIEQQRDAMRMLLPEIQKASEARSKSEFQRQLAAAGVRQNILTAANMLERSQQAAQQMGATAAQQAGAALTQQYQYS